MPNIVDELNKKGLLDEVTDEVFSELAKIVLNAYREGFDSGWDDAVKHIKESNSTTPT